MEHVPAPLSALARRRALLTALSAAAMLIAALAGSWICAPFALAFAGFAYLWSQHTPSGEDPQSCRGCAQGCAGCRERIDSPARDGR